VGRQIKKLKNIDLAYIAGFLDGDGSIMFQLKRRKDTPKRRRLMFTICFYQDTRHEKPLFWIRKIFGIGYISRRNDGMTELRINGYEQVEKILRNLWPYLKFKKEQVKYILCVLDILSKKKINQLTKKERVKIVNAFVAARKQTYQSGQKKIEKLREDLRIIMKL
jgi:hypothetical protein